MFKERKNNFVDNIMQNLPFTGLHKVLILISCIFLLLSCKKDRINFGDVDNSFELATLISNDMIFDQSPHSAFTDLLQFEGKYYLTFRTGSDHGAARDGKIAVMVSEDLNRWKNAATFTYPNYDLRDPKLLIGNDGNLVVHAAAFWYSSSRYLMNRNFVSYVVNKSIDQISEAPNFISGTVNFWPWRFTYSTQSYYSYGYNGTMGLFRLYSGDSLGNIRTLCNLDSLLGGATEGTIKFNNNKSYSLIRSNDKTYVGTADMNNACDISWDTLPIPDLGGPNFVLYKNKYMIIGGRENIGVGNDTMYDRTSLFLYNFENKSLVRIIVLPSGFDTGYPGFILSGNRLNVSYYSTESQHSRIYLAKIQLNF